MCTSLMEVCAEIVEEMKTTARASGYTAERTGSNMTYTVQNQSNTCNR